MGSVGPLEASSLLLVHSSSSVTLFLGLEVQSGEDLVLLMKPAGLQGIQWEEEASLRGFSQGRTGLEG